MTISWPMSGRSAARNAPASLSAPIPTITVAGVGTHIIAPGFDKGGGGGRRVRAIENEISVADSDPLEAAGPAGSCESGADGRFRKMNAGRIDNAQCRQRGAGVLDLMWAGDSDREVRQSSPWSSGLERAPRPLPGPIPASDLERRTDLGRGSDNRLLRGRHLGARNRRNAPPQDPRFLPGDVGVGGTEDRSVLEIDAGDDRDDRIDHVGRVVAAAKPDLDDCQIAVAPGERVEGHRGEHLEGCDLTQFRLGGLQAPRRGRQPPASPRRTHRPEAAGRRVRFAPEIGGDVGRCRTQPGDPPCIAAEAMKAPVDPFPLDPAM